MQGDRTCLLTEKDKPRKTVRHGLTQAPTAMHCPGTSLGTSFTERKKRHPIRHRWGNGPQNWTPMNESEGAARILIGRGQIFFRRTSTRSYRDDAIVPFAEEDEGHDENAEEASEEARRNG